MFSKHDSGVEQKQNILQVQAKIKVGSALETRVVSYRTPHLVYFQLTYIL